MKIKGIYLKYLLNHSYIRSLGGELYISPKARLKNVKAYIYSGGSLIIGDDCILENCVISVQKGKIELADNVIVVGQSHSPVQINVENGNITVRDHVKLSCNRIWVRFGGELKIDKYTNLNRGSEIRCDEKVTIGAFNGISYNVRIWDTNTHSFLSKLDRQDVRIRKFPYFGYEESKPVTAPVSIGNDCWIGENCTLLKGTRLGDGVIVGYGTLISGKVIPDGAKAFNHIQLEIR